MDASPPTSPRAVPADANPYRALPAVERVLAQPPVTRLVAEHGPQAVGDIVRAVLARERERITTDDSATDDRATGDSATGDSAAVLDRIVSAVVAGADALRPSLRAVVNATGVVVHTNLGRAPLSRATIEAMAAVSTDYSNLEFDLSAGERGSRFDHLEAPLRRVTGAEAGLAVNNNAAALLLALTALCTGGEVIISRGQLVEIGGGFRIPDVMRQSGATLVEVGTTNRTRLADYASACTERTAAILRVHPSNFRVVGFTEEVALPDLVALARRRRLPLIDDLGSGALLDAERFGLHGEPRVQASVAAGADVVLFSGDKLLGGPQAGIAVGAQRPLAQMRRHPLSRALRPDKATIAGLAATLRHYELGEAEREVPVWRMIAAPLPELERRAGDWAEAWNAAAADARSESGAESGAEYSAAVEPGRSVVGGGSLPGEGLRTALCALTPTGSGSAARLARALREGDPPIVARIDRERLLLDPRTVDPAADEIVARRLGALALG